MKCLYTCEYIIVCTYTANIIQCMLNHFAVYIIHVYIYTYYVLGERTIVKPFLSVA